MVVKAKAKKKDVKVVSGVVHVHTSSNNTLINIVDAEWNKIVGWGTWKVGYKGSKKSTPYFCAKSLPWVDFPQCLQPIRTTESFISLLIRFIITYEL